MKIIENFLTNNDCYKQREIIIVKGLMLHSVGVPQPKASVFVKSWNKANYNTCVHGFIDGNTGDLYQTLPWTYRGWHAGGRANDTHIGIEMCEPSSIEYIKGKGSQFTCSNLDDAKEVAKRTYKSAVEHFAKLCTEFHLDPMGNGVIISHKEGAARGVASNHGDPEHLWSQLDLPYTMNTFRAAVKKAMTKEEPVNDDKLYKVQLGAYKVKTNATKLKDKVKKAGFDAYVTYINGYYKVQVGAYSVKSNAENMLQRLKNAGYPNTYITVLENKEVVQPDITVGDKVTVTKAIDYSGKKIALYYAIYDVIQVNDNKVVIGIGKDITAAVNKKNLKKV